MMGRQSQHVIVFSILALLSFAIWKYYFDHEIIPVDKPFTKGYSVDNLELKITDETGALTAKFKSPKLIRYTDNPIVHIDKPLFWTYEEGKQHWSIVSKKAEYNSDTLQVNLLEDLKGQTVNDESQMMFKAENLMVDLKSKIAKTSDGIELNQKQLLMTGQIAEFDLKNETLEVNNNVKAIYKTNNNKSKNDKAEK